jgi:hypothetical protein
MIFWAAGFIPHFQKVVKWGREDGGNLFGIQLRHKCLFRIRILARCVIMGM